MDGSMNVNRERDSIWAAILVFFVVAGIVGVVWVGYAWTTGQGIPRTLVESGPFMLVLVTLINIGLSGLGFLEARKERRLTRETLRESRKNGVIEMIVLTAEAIQDELRANESRFKTDDGTSRTYPALPTFEEPDEELLSDLSSYYPDLVEDLGKYENIRYEYHTHREEIKTRLNESIPGNLDDELLDELLKATGSSLESVNPNPEGDTYYNRLDEYSEKLVHVTLMQELPKEAVFGNGSSKGWIDDNIASLREVLTKLRSTDEFRDDFEKLDELQTSMASQNELIQERVASAKAELKEQYNISEAEIRKRKESASVST
jgi:hypothetical protein